MLLVIKAIDHPPSVTTETRRRGTEEKKEEIKAKQNQVSLITHVLAIATRLFRLAFMFASLEAPQVAKRRKSCRLNELLFYSAWIMHLIVCAHYE